MILDTYIFFTNLWYTWSSNFSKTRYTPDLKNLQKQVDSIMPSWLNLGTTISRHETMMDNSTGPHDLAVHTEEAEDRPF